jgi:hypothetical protein
LVVVAHGASAQTAPTANAAESREYSEAIDEAVSEYEAGHFPESRALFQRAHSLMPNARTLRGLGMVEFELRSYGASVRFLELALAAPVKRLDGELRSETEHLLARALAFVGHFTLALQPANATLAVDGSPAELDAHGTLVLAVGDHTLDASAPGYASEHRTLRVTGGERQPLQIALPAQHALTATPLGAARPIEHDSSLFSSPWLWVAIGAVVVGAGVGIGIASSSGHSVTQKPYGGDTDVVLSGP